MIRPTRVRRLRRRRALKATIVVVGMTASVLIVSSAWAKDVTLVIDGHSQEVHTRSTSVEDLLTDQGVPLSIGLQVQPPPGTTLADGMTVVVSPPPGVPADGFQAAVTSTGVGVWVVERPDAGPFGKADPATEEASTFAVGVGPSEVTVRAVVAGKVHDVSTNAATTEALLTAMGIQPDADDRVVPPPSTPLHDGMTVRFDTVQTVVHRALTPIPFAVRTDYTSKLTPGQLGCCVQEQQGSRGRRSKLVSSTAGSCPPPPCSGRSSNRRSPSVGCRRRGRCTTARSSSRAREPRPRRGEASWYDPPWSGLTAAHPWLPFGTLVTVTDRPHGRSVTVVIDDRGPFGPGRIIDLSPEAFAQLSPLGRGVLDVELNW